MKLPLLIGLSGYKGVGKDAFADVLAREYGYRKVAFAEGLKREVSRWISDRDKVPGDVSTEILELLDACRLEFEEWDKAQRTGYMYAIVSLVELCYEWVAKKPYSDNLRRLLQLAGTEYFRAKDLNWWLKSIKINPGVKTVITDVRFENESIFVSAIGGACVRIANPDSANTDQHQSETDVDYTLKHLTVVNRHTGLDSVVVLVAGMLADLERIDPKGVQFSE